MTSWSRWTRKSQSHNPKQRNSPVFCGLTIRILVGLEYKDFNLDHSKESKVLSKKVLENS